MNEKCAVILAVVIVLSAAGAMVLFNEMNCQRGLVFTLLNDHLQKAADDFYAEYLSELPAVSNYCGQVLGIKREDKGFWVRIAIQPYIGPHFPVGDDEADFFVDNLGMVTLTDYFHRRNYELPGRLGVTVKEPIPIS